MVPGVENLLKLGGLAPPFGTLVVPGTTWHHPMSAPGPRVITRLSTGADILKNLGGGLKSEVWGAKAWWWGGAETGKEFS